MRITDMQVVGCPQKTALLLLCEKRSSAATECGPHVSDRRASDEFGRLAGSTRALFGDPYAPFTLLKGSRSIVALKPRGRPGPRQGATMRQKRLQHLVVGGALLAALAPGGSPGAGAATDSSGSSSTATSPQTSNGRRLPARGSPRAPGEAADGTADPTVAGAGALHHVRDGWTPGQYLTDHEQYVRHHQRLASQAG